MTGGPPYGGAQWEPRVQRQGRTPRDTPVGPLQLTQHTGSELPSVLTYQHALEHKATLLLTTTGPPGRCPSGLMGHQNGEVLGELLQGTPNPDHSPHPVPMTASLITGMGASQQGPPARTATQSACFLKLGGSALRMILTAASWSSISFSVTRKMSS